MYIGNCPQSYPQCGDALVYLGLSLLTPRIWPRSLNYLSTTRFATFISLGRIYRMKGWVMPPSLLTYRQQKSHLLLRLVEVPRLGGQTHE